MNWILFWNIVTCMTAILCVGLTWGLLIAFAWPPIEYSRLIWERKWHLKYDSCKR